MHRDVEEEGDSGLASDGSYRFTVHARYLDVLFEASLGLTENVTPVGHD